jgi:hypothetical protein
MDLRLTLKFLFFLCAAVVLCLAPVAHATTQSLDITVTRGSASSAALTTFTFVNDSGSTLPAGTPITFGQGFRYGDIMPGTHPLIRDAITHVVLPGQQWNEISTWRENGSNRATNYIGNGIAFNQRKRGIFFQRSTWLSLSAMTGTGSRST